MVFDSRDFSIVGGRGVLSAVSLMSMPVVNAIFDSVSSFHRAADENLSAAVW